MKTASRFKTTSLVIIGLAAAFTAIVLFVPETKKTPPRTAEVGAAAPEFELKAHNGKLWRLSDQKGSVVLVNFWASWCDSCKKEMPSLQRLYDLTKDNPGFRIMTVLFNDKPEDALQYLRQNKYTLPFLIDADGSVSAAYGLTGVPETFVIDKNGIILNKIIGPLEFDSPQAIDYFTGLTKG
ncbi:MAG: TlpA disulfide reductase family protein [Thermodesulfovibrionales bacterium]|nr:TlpA disulfide reductase family protein [Thermodesulfovibrionales bacterium]